ncbi:MAG: Gfo/Idh/MocA family oxidoreductase [Pseudomonadota bacterium]
MKRDITIAGQPENKTGMQKLRVGVLGMGFMGGTHTFAWKNGKSTFNWPCEVELTALFDMSEDSLTLNGGRFGFGRVTQDWREVTEADDVDVVSICTPNFAHPEMALSALEHGKHVWCEKPMATSLDDARAMVAAAKASNAKTMLGYNYMKSPALLAIKRLIDEGTIGDIVHFRGVYAEDFMCDPMAPHSWRLTKAGGGKGALGDMGSHQVSMAIWLCGPLRDVAARLQTVHGQRPGPDGEMLAVETDDHFSAIGSFESGAMFTMHTSWLGQGHKMNLGFEVTGTKGAIIFDQEAMGEFQLYEMGDRKGGFADTDRNGFKRVLIGPQHPPFGNFCPAPGHHVGFNEMKVIEVGEFVRAILEDDQAYPNFADGLVFEEALQAIQDASEAKVWRTLGGAA